MSVIKRDGGISEPVPQRLQVSLAADQGGRRKGQRHPDEFIHCCVVSRCPRAANKRVTGCTRQVECSRQRAHGLDVRPASLPALQRAHAMNGEPRNRRELLLGVARSLAKCFQLRAE